MNSIPSKNRLHNPGDHPRFDNPYLTKKEVCALLSICTRTLDRWCAARRFPVIPIGGVRRFLLSDVLAYMERHRQATFDEMASQSEGE